MDYRPRIAITRWEEVLGEDIGDYHRRVLEAGGEPLDLCIDFVVHQECCCLDTLGGATGLILTGGYDIDSALYGEPRHPRVKYTDRTRDEFELVLLRQALVRDLAVLAICRGHQFLNVTLGGSLDQHLEDRAHRADYRSEGFPSGWHDVAIREGSRLHAALGADSAVVNSRHHQAVTPERLAPRLEVVASSPDGVVEGVESLAHRWVVGVQWHPERLEPEQDGFAHTSTRLFRELVRQARRIPVRL
jgi:putative glutamine amidotransferase